MNSSEICNPDQILDFRILISKGQIGNFCRAREKGIGWEK